VGADHKHARSQSCGSARWLWDAVAAVLAAFGSMTAVASLKKKKKEENDQKKPKQKSL